jgi:hypothetical protein
MVLSVATEIISSDTTGNRSRDLPTSSAVPYPLRYPRPHDVTDIQTLNKDKFHTCIRHHTYSHTRRRPVGWSEHEDREQNPVPCPERENIYVYLYIHIIIKYIRVSHTFTCICVKYTTFGTNILYRTKVKYTANLAEISTLQYKK